MKRIFLIDLVGDYDGHYFIMKTLGMIPNSFFIDTQEKKIHKEQPIKCLLERFRMLKRVKKEIKKHVKIKSIAHFLTGDKFIILPLIQTIYTKKVSVIITLHRFPEGRIIHLLLKNFSTKINTFIVYSEYIEKQMNTIGIYNVKTIQYPSFYDYSLLSNKEQLKEKYNVKNKIVITALGGTRYEKGLDILLEAFKYIPENLKEDIVLNIAGKEEYFSSEYIQDKANQYRINIRLALKRLSDNDFCENVKMTDIMVIPYRKEFRSGASGPMTEAMSLGIPSIFPSEHSLELYNSYKVGKTFKCENARSLANSIVDLIMNQYTINYDTCQLFKKENFIEQHVEIYNKFLKE